MKRYLSRCGRGFWAWIAAADSLRVTAGKSPGRVPGPAVIFFPFLPATACCGLAGLVTIKKRSKPPETVALGEADAMAAVLAESGLDACLGRQQELAVDYLGGKGYTRKLLNLVRQLKRDDAFVDLFLDADKQRRVLSLADQLQLLASAETDSFSGYAGRLNTTDAATVTRRLEDLKDAHWCLTAELLANVERVTELSGGNVAGIGPGAVLVYKKLNAVLNSIDRLEVRGRDSAGISLMFDLSPDDYAAYEAALSRSALEPDLALRREQPVMVNGTVRVRESGNTAQGPATVITFTYKVAAEIGHLGDNVKRLRREIMGDEALRLIVGLPHLHHTVVAHTRWASVGAITEPNCHPVDNLTQTPAFGTTGTLHVCLNGDIDNYLTLKAEHESNGGKFHEEVSTDTKIIPLQIEKYLAEGHSVDTAFRLAVNDFKGSHAISMHTDLMPGKLFLAQRGSGQAVFVGIGEDHYMPASEVYGFVEETDRFIRLDGEKVVQGKAGTTQGQIVILDQRADSGVAGIQGCYYDGTPLTFNETDIETTAITSRDIDRQDFPHYFLKEISESPMSVARTLQNRWRSLGDEADTYSIDLDDTVIPDAIKDALHQNAIKRIYVVGQGTAGVAAQVVADILSYYAEDPSLYISAVKASEMSGFKLQEGQGPTALVDTLVIAISQSGTTTDTNRTVDMVKERGGHTLAIVNRRDSDITFKVDGVLYTSSGRDIEMSVASTKAFYSQIVAGAMLGLYIAQIKGARDAAFVSREIKRLLKLPDHMRSILSMKARIGESAKKLAVSKTYWATVGSGPNKASADEIRIKLSELCYKTISADYVEDKKHIDLSSEPLILICAAGTRETVLGDIIKDTAIFQAHKASPVVIADEGEDRFEPYAEDVFHVPRVHEHLAPIVNTLAGHIWGYYAALAINDGSRFLHEARKGLKAALDDYGQQGLDVYEVVLERGFRERIADFYSAFRQLKKEKRLPGFMGLSAASDIALLLKYLAGRLPVSDFELDFDKKGTAANMLTTLFERLGEAINTMARPVDAIKHQAKTVTVGTSRISSKVEGMLFDALAAHGISPSQLINRNVLVLKNFQKIVGEIKGAILYRVEGLNALGELTEKTTIHVLEKEGVLAKLPSRVETDHRLKGTKRIIVNEGNVYIGKGRKDNRNIIIAPAISASSATSNLIEFLLLLTIDFKTNIDLAAKIKALGGKYERIKNIVDENSLVWEDEYLNVPTVGNLFGWSAEKIAEDIVSKCATSSIRDDHN